MFPANGQEPMPAISTAGNPHRDLLNRYCITCHNERLRTAELLLDHADVENVSDGAEVWEKVVLKLRARAMPPAGAGRPDQASLESFASYLEAELDRAAATHPDPGRPVVHRLNRAEYTNSIRDLLALEIDGTSLLPPDTAGYGFDNIADVLAVSPLLMERYILAAGKISRLALGDAAMRPVDESYEVSREFVQGDRSSEDLPFGSRGGIAIRHPFPADGEYVIQIRLQKNFDGYIRGLGKQHRLDVRLDGRRVHLFTVGGQRPARSGPIFTASQNPDYAGDPEQVAYEFTADEALEVRFPAKAGIHLVGVSFLKQTVKPEGMLTPPLLLSDLGHYKGGEPAVDKVTIIGPYEAKGPGETPSRSKILVCSPASAEEEEPCARQILSTLAGRAFRRPVTAEDLEELLSLYRTGRGQRGFEGGLEMALQSILAGPEFLFRVERDPENVAPNTAYRISDLELASRISFFLWSSIPDDELRLAAEQGRLRDPAVLEQQVRRMLSDPRSQALVENFAGQWLYLRNLRSAAPDPGLFPEFDEELRQAFRQETELLFQNTLQQDRSVLELLDADYTFVNERLARHYGIPNIHGSRFRRVAVIEEERRGLLGQGSMLTATSYGNRTSPVLRGKWVLEQLLGVPPPAPPPNVPALEEKNKDGRTLTMRQQMEQHRANAVCAGCHRLMDPIGFALENFDAVGKLRTAYAELNAPIDASGVLYDGSRFQGVVELRKILLSHPEQFVHTLTEKILTYALGRQVEYSDASAVRKILRHAGPSDYRWSSLILGIVQSTPFQMRRSREL